MTIKYLLMTLTVTLLLALSQVLVKLGLDKINGFSISIKTIITDVIPIITSAYIMSGFLAVFISSLLWMKILSKVNFSIAYPMISFSYIFGLLAAKYIFGETISITRWVGVGVIMLGIVLIMRG